MIIFGASLIGGIIYDICKSEKIDITAFCDNDFHKVDFMGKRVILPEMLTKDDEVIIATSYIADVIPQLDCKWHTCLSFLKHYKAKNIYEQYLIDACMWSHRHIFDNKISIRSLDVMITEKCSLNCKDCSNLMQYYEQPRNFDTQEMLNSIDGVCEFIDNIFEFRVIGGEVFMNKYWYLIVNKLVEKKKARILVFSNGTIVPQNIDKMKRDNVIFWITDYGELSKNILNIKNLLDKWHIPYHCFKASNWTNCGEIREHFRLNNDDIFNKCCARNLITLKESKLYRCPFSANLYGSIDGITLKNKQSVRDFLASKQSLSACDFCNGRRLNDPIIKAGIQCK